MKRVEDINVVRIQPLSPPETLKAELPASEKANRTVTEGRDAIRRVLRKDDSRGCSSSPAPARFTTRSWRSSTRSV